MPRVSAGILAFRRTATGVEVLVAHPGGPMWARRDDGAWTIPKGLVDDGETDLLAVARREFAEETGHPAPDGPYLDLGEVRLRSGKVVRAWGAEGDLDAATARSNEFDLEWPVGSGRIVRVPEIDRVAWMAPGDARRALNPIQAELVDRLLGAIDASPEEAG